MVIAAVMGISISGRIQFFVYMHMWHVSDNGSYCLF